MSKSEPTPYPVRRGINDTAQFFLAEAGILAVEKTISSNMKKLAKATRGRIVRNFEDLAEKDPRSAGLVEEKKVDKDTMVFVRDCSNPGGIDTVEGFQMKGNVLDRNNRAS